MSPTRKRERIHYALIKALKPCGPFPLSVSHMSDEGVREIIYEVLLRADCLWFVEEAKPFSCFLSGMNLLSICFLLARTSPLVFSVRHSLDCSGDLGVRIGSY